MDTRFLSGYCFAVQVLRTSFYLRLERQNMPVSITNTAIQKTNLRTPSMRRFLYSSVSDLARFSKTFSAKETIIMTKATLTQQKPRS